MSMLKMLREELRSLRELRDSLCTKEHEILESIEMLSDAYSFAGEPE